MTRRKLIAWIGLLFLLCGLVLVDGEKAQKAATQSSKGQPAENVVLHLPGPELVWPLSGEVDLSGREKLEFRWNPAPTPYHVFCYLFRIYRGRGTGSNDEIYAQQVSGLDTSIGVPIQYFKQGEIYTWRLQQVNLVFKGRLLFSDPVLRSFKATRG